MSEPSLEEILALAEEAAAEADAALAAGDSDAAEEWHELLTAQLHLAETKALSESDVDLSEQWATRKTLLDLAVAANRQGGIAAERAIRDIAREQDQLLSRAMAAAKVLGLTYTGPV